MPLDHKKNMSLPYHVHKHIVEFINKHNLAHPKNPSLMDFEEFVFKAYKDDAPTASSDYVWHFVRQDKLRPKALKTVYKIRQGLTVAIKENDTTYVSIESVYAAIKVGIDKPADMPYLFDQFIAAVRTASYDIDSNGMPDESDLTPSHIAYTHHMKELKRTIAAAVKEGEKQKAIIDDVIAGYKQKVAEADEALKTVADIIADNIDKGKKIAEKDKYIAKLNTQLIKERQKALNAAADQQEHYKALEDTITNLQASSIDTLRDMVMNLTSPEE